MLSTRALSSSPRHLRSRSCSSEFVEEVADATGESVARRFGYAYVDSFGTVSPAGPAPYLDCVAAPAGPATDAARRLGWLADAEDKAMSWIIANQLPEYLAEVQPRRLAELTKARDLVTKRLSAETERLLLDAAVASEKEQKGEKPKESSDSLNRKAVELDSRLRKRLALLDQQQLMSTKPPHIVTAALVLPIGMLEGEIPASAPIHAKETKESNAAASTSSWHASENSVASLSSRPSTTPASTSCRPTPRATPTGSRSRHASRAPKDFFVTHNEVMTGKNAVPRYRLALVKVDPRGAAVRRGPLPRRPVRDHRPRRLRGHRHPRRLGQDLGEGRIAVLMLAGPTNHSRSTQASGPRVSSCTHHAPHQRRGSPVISGTEGRGTSAQAQADRGGSAAGGDQPGVRAGEVDPPRLTRRPCTCGGRGGRWRLLAPCCLRSSWTTRRRSRSEFPTEEVQRQERERLHELIERLVVWENARDEKLLAEARAEILEVDRRQPAADPRPVRRRRHDSAGGAAAGPRGARLRPQPGGRADQQGADRDPAEVPDQPPVFPGLADSEIRDWRGAEGLAADVRAYGEWMRDEAEERIGHLYPNATLADGSAATAYRLDLGADGRCPEPGMRHRDAAGPLMVARQEEGQGGLRRSDGRG